MEGLKAGLIAVGGVVLIVSLAIALAFAGYALTGYLLMLLWNWLVPSLFAGPTITFWQSIGLIFLISILGGALGLRRSSN